MIQTGLLPQMNADTRRWDLMQIRQAAATVSAWPGLDSRAHQRSTLICVHLRSTAVGKVFHPTV
jgi:hypothetical protein